MKELVRACKNAMEAGLPALARPFAGCQEFRDNIDFAAYFFYTDKGNIGGHI